MARGTRGGVAAASSAHRGAAPLRVDHRARQDYGRRVGAATAAFIHIPKAAGTSFMKASVDWMSRKDTRRSRSAGVARDAENAAGAAGALSRGVVMQRHPVQLAGLPILLLQAHAQAGR